MHYPFSPHMQVPLQHLLKKIQSLGLTHPFGVLFEVISKSATFHQLQNQIDKLPLRRHLVQFNSIFRTRQLHPTQRCQSCDLATEKIPGNLIFHHPGINCLHCHLFLRVIFVIPKVYISSRTPSQKLVLHYYIFCTYLPVHVAIRVSMITDIKISKIKFCSKSSRS